MKQATHVSWYLHTGDWPTKHMCHKCDNPSCVNPHHLFEGTHQDNMDDKVRKGRQPRGSEMAVAILTEAKVQQIKDLLKYKKPREIEDLLGVNYWSIIKIKNNKQWQHV